MKKVTILLILLNISFNSFSQELDKVYLKNKEVVSGKILNVTSESIEINPKGSKPFLIIKRDKVKLIVYSDNTIVSFNSVKNKGKDRKQNNPLEVDKSTPKASKPELPNNKESKIHFIRKAIMWGDAYYVDFYLYNLSKPVPLKIAPGQRITVVVKPGKYRLYYGKYNIKDVLTGNTTSQMIKVKSGESYYVKMSWCCMTILSKSKGESYYNSTRKKRDETYNFLKDR